MAETSRTLARLLPRRTLTDADGRGLVLWLVVLTLGAVASLVVLTLYCDLIVTRGRVSYDSPSAVLEQHRERIVALGQDAGLWAQAVRFGDLSGWRWLPTLCRVAPLVSSSQGAIAFLIGMGLCLAIVLMFSRSASRACAHRTARDLATRLRKSIHRQTLRLGPSDLTGQRHQLAFKLFTDVVDEIRESLVQYRWRLTRGVLLVPAMLVSALVIDWRLALQCLIPTAACWWVYRYERQRGAAQRLLMESYAESEARFLADGLKQTRLVRGYNMEQFEETLFENHLSRLTTETTQGRKLEHGAIRFARIVVTASVAIVLLLISLRVVSTVDPLPLSNGLVLAIALGVIAKESTSIERALGERRKLIGTGERIYRYLDEIPEVGQAVGAKFIQPVSKSVVLEAVHYHNNGHEILRGIDLRIEAKSTVSLVSLDPLLPRAVAYLLPRFIEPTRGRVLFDGEDIAWGTLESIHAETLYVGGDDPLLSGSVLENLICGDSRLTMQDAIEAAKTVHVNKFISSLPSGYETILGEHGTTLGVGEAFQIGLARAVLRDPAVLIIQEPEAILEDDLRTAIDDAYQRITPGRTVIFLPSRLSTIRRCQQVILLHDGKVEGLGSHSDLRKASELYRHWDYITFNSFSRESRRLQSGMRL